MKTQKVAILVIALLALFTPSCKTARTSRVSQTQIQLAQYALKKRDLPGFGWSDKGGSWESNDAGESYGVVFISTVDK